VYAEMTRKRASSLPTPRNKKPVVWLVHANEAAGAACAKELAGFGYRSVQRCWSSPEITRAKADPPAAVLIDLSRIPSVGRDVAIAMRSHRALLTVPFLLVDGAPEVVANLRKFLPDAVVSEGRRIKTSLAGVLKRQPPGARLLSVFAAYESAPLAKKLGIKTGSVVAVRDAPRGLKAKLGELPAGARLIAHGKAPRDLTMWFVHSRDVLVGEISAMKQHGGSGSLWILWNKNASSDAELKLTQPIVRKAGLSAGLVDFKITRVDDDWAGLRFTVRKK
jgi:hypothetical protein